MTEYEFEDTAEIAVADNPIGKLILLVAVVLTAICLYYFATGYTRPAPAPESAPVSVSSTPNP